jgi:transmembrane sensor
MTTHGASRIRDEILGEASRWFIELNEHAQDEATRRAFDGWLRRSPEHVHAFLQISAHWEESTPRADAAVESIDELVALAKSDANVVSFTHATCPLVPPTRAFAAHGVAVRPIRWLGVTLAACVLLSVTAAFVWNQYFRGSYSTGLGEQRSLRLADGSTVELNSQTRIRVRYTSQERHIDLLEGQALFHVAKNQAQPFIVASGNTHVRAIGTQFDVYRKQSSTVVTVVEGKVAVEPALSEYTVADAGESPVDALGSAISDPASGSVLLEGGQQLTLAVDAASAAPARLRPADLEATTAWTQRRLIFRGTPLAEVVSEFNRYSERPMVVSDAQLAALPISGVFSSSDPTDLLRFLRDVGGYEVRETRTAIEISPRVP